MKMLLVSFVYLITLWAVTHVVLSLSSQSKSDLLLKIEILVNSGKLFSGATHKVVLSNRFSASYHDLPQATVYCMSTSVQIKLH